MNRWNLVATCAALACSTAWAASGRMGTPDNDPQDPIRIQGAVFEQGTGTRIVGAWVVALQDGTQVQAYAKTDAKGLFQLDVEEGFYDLRATMPGKDSETRYIASFLHNISVGRGVSRDIQIELVPLNMALEQRGFDPSFFDDLDGDFIPDRLERDYRLDPEDADSDDDGVMDGIAAWLGVGRRSARPRRSVTLHSPLGALPLAAPSTSGAVPIPIVTELIPGATRYALEVFGGTADRLLDRQEFDFEAGDFIAGEGLALRWTPPVGLGDGRYQLVISGYAPGEPDPLKDIFTFEFVTEDREPEALEIHEDVELSGLVHASSIRIFKGATLRVPTGSALFLSAVDNILIEDGARVEAGVGASLWMSARQRITIRGSVRSGDGSQGEPIRSTSRRDVEAGQGGAGGDLMLVSAGSIHISWNGSVLSGAGGSGAQAHGNVGIAGNGGAGGRVVLIAPELSIADRPARIDVGAGGNGGSGVSPGVGGASGDIWLSDWDLRKDQYVPLGLKDYPIVGGLAGEVGEAEAGTPAEASAQQSRDGSDSGTGSGRVGQPGWLIAGAGQSASAVGGAGGGRGRGGNASATGGMGGRVARIGMGRNGFGLTFGFVATGGRGGTATANSGQGGTGDNAGSVGRAGEASAWGGAGGAGHGIPIAMPSRGGAGGAASASGADGRKGENHCGRPTRIGGKGSTGGKADATGGSGGHAVWFGGGAGSAQAVGGAGGEGGDGGPAGRGGTGGSAGAQPGRRGEGRLLDGEKGTSADSRGQRGQRGAEC